MKNFLIILIFIIYSINVYCQDDYYVFYDDYKEAFDSLPIYGITKTENIFVLGIKKFDTLVYVLPDITCIGNISNIKFEQIITEKQNLYVYFDLPYFEDFNYHVFDSIYYIMFPYYFSKLIWDFVLPNVSNEVAELIKKTYPEKITLFNLSIENREEEGCYIIRKINHKKFLCLFMKLSFYNSIRMHISNPNFLFKNSKFEQGLYIKVLIPLKED
jgi:hypothetical protein